MRISLLMCTALLGLGMAGCSSSGARDGSGPRAGSDPGPASSRTSPAAGAGLAQVQERMVYFEFDSAALDSAGRATVAQWAQELKSKPQLKVRLEGHADERGTREYNVALGERRARTVQQALLADGVSPQQLSVVSYGEERPAADGSGESAWRQNRRVELAQ